MIGAMLLFFPALVLLSAAALVVLTWPLFVGGYLSYGLVPFLSTGGGLRIPQSDAAVTTTWYVITAGWLVVLAVTPAVISRVRKRRGARHIDATVEELLSPDEDPVEPIVNKPRPK